MLKEIDLEKVKQFVKDNEDKMIPFQTQVDYNVVIEDRTSLSINDCNYMIEFLRKGV